jgi:hypothetical protein
MPALPLRPFSKTIEVPERLRNQRLDTRKTSARLTALLDRFGIRVLGDLNGRTVVEFAREKNCGPKTLYELDLLARRARSRNGKVFHNGHPRGCASASHVRSCSPTAITGKAATRKILEDAADFVIPESLWHLSFDELPTTRRLANVVRLNRTRTLGDLHGCNACELIRYKACGWGTISEIQQLIERAISGEFDIAPIQQGTVVAELLSLLERGLAKLPPHGRQFVLSRIGGQMGRRYRPQGDLLCMSHAEIGRRFGLTRARVHKVFVNSMDTLKKMWGPRVPRLLEVIKSRCLSMVCPLTPRLLGKWIESSPFSNGRAKTPACFTRFQLSMEAHVRLIAALDKGIPCWLKTNGKPEHTGHSVDGFDIALAQTVRQAGGHISVAEAYRCFSEHAEHHSRPLTVTSFLRRLPSAQCSTLEFEDLERPIIRLRSPNAEVFPCDVSAQNGKSSTTRKTRCHSPADQFFGAKSGFCETHVAATR